LERLKDNSHQLEEQMHFKEDNKPKIMNENEEKINKDLLNSLKNRNLI